jgi:hypothetical protein
MKNIVTEASRLRRTKNKIVTEASGLVNKEDMTTKIVTEASWLRKAKNKIVTEASRLRKVTLSSSNTHRTSKRTKSIKANTQICFYLKAL